MKEYITNSLIKTLTQMGIEPIGCDAVIKNIHTVHRRIKVYGDLAIPIVLPEEELMMVMANI